ncbi:hypothetical protein F4820DRAFT_242451 [Hypoxylon rubiginosum]|uniref:Uncharacterized protein n=1 Tax=Hypoxylon rubiginosum TaxID=110542 RepID=A0ACB9Z591_9PEZI|nr:hypothetical protein F4820DRAFT_242451 [Hypoxylon rubiginosum]
MTRYAQASDPRDYLFARMALSDNELEHLCRPNYDISAEEVWRTFFQEYVRQKRDLYIICLAGAKLSEYRHLPSWLPNWSEVTSAYPLCNFHQVNRPEWPHFDAAKGTKPDVSFTPSGHHLSCIGLEIDEVDGIGDSQSTTSNNAYITPEDACQALVRTTLADTNRWGEPSKSPEAFELIFAAVCNRFRSEMDWPPSPNFEARWSVMKKLNLGGTPLEDLIELRRKTAIHGMWAVERHISRAFKYSYSHAMFMRELFTTLRGFLGLGPGTAGSKDKIVILKGCRVPVIMRQRGQYWELVGECYVDGIMYGEALDNKLGDDQEPAWKTFNII